MYYFFLLIFYSELSISQKYAVVPVDALFVGGYMVLLIEGTKMALNLLFDSIVEAQTPVQEPG
ncbi:MAG: hypothetical protein Q8L02_06310, partial [Candidatus Nitrotoga sp.]|nr:hypothetical protein [Candidatus Nitrotoga sp.]